MRLHKQHLTLACLSLPLLLSACSNDDDDPVAAIPVDDNPVIIATPDPTPVASPEPSPEPSPIPTPIPSAEVEATGIYDGTLTLDSDVEVAIVEAIVARDGKTTLNIYADDSENVTAIAAGATTQSGDSISFSGLLHDGSADGTAATLSASVIDDALLGEFSAEGFNGTLSLNRSEELQNVGAALSNSSGDYLFKNDGKVWQIGIAVDGTVAATDGGNCNFGGQLSVLDSTVNVYTLAIDSGNCSPFIGELSGTAHTDSIEITNDILNVSVAGDSGSLSADWFKQ